MKTSNILAAVQGVVEQVFGEAGLLVARGGRHTPEQLAYAQTVARVLCGSQDQPASVGIIEAETGIGKSLGYLVPALAFIGIKNRGRRGEPVRVIVSTHTRALQRQILDIDLPLAGALVDAAGVTPPVWAFRMGCEAFWSPARVEHHLEELNRSHPLKDDKATVAQWNALLRAAKQSVHTGSGLWLDYLADAARWPAGVASKDICLVSGAMDDNDRYTAHKEAAADAQLVVTNHATLMTSLGNEGVLGDQWAGLVVDEAHTLRQVAESFSTTRLQPREMAIVARRVAAMFPGMRRPKQLEEVADALEATLMAAKRKDSNFQLNSQEIGSAIVGLAAEALRVAKDLHKACSARIKEAGYSREDVAAVADLEHIKVSLERWIEKSPYLQKGVAYSPVREYPSLLTASAFPGGLVKALIALRAGSTVFTSATLSDGLGKEDSFRSFRREMGIAEQDVVVEARLSPRHYGSLDFVVSASEAPPPFLHLRDDDAESLTLSGDWVKHCAAMIREAMATGKTLVLTGSFTETRALCEAIGHANLIEHQAGATVGELLPDFREGDAAALLSPGAWEGVSLQTARGGQIIKNLVITRLPFPSPDPGMDALRRELMVSRGYSATSSDQVLMLQRLSATCQRLRQGIGRAIRGPSHKVTVWICDPRMPRIGAGARFQSLLGAIPARFRGKYAAARVFTPAGTASNTRRPIMRGAK